MSRSPLLPWVLLTLWAVWIYALQGLFSSGALAPWFPEVGIVLLASLSARLPTSDLPKVALCLGLARVAVSADPAVAIMAGTLGAVALARSLRGVLEIQSPLMMFFLASTLTLGWFGWLTHVHDVRAHAALTPTGPLRPGVLEIGGTLHWRAALSTGLFALLFGRAIAHLPGISPLLKRRAWQVAGSQR